MPTARPPRRPAGGARAAAPVASTALLLLLLLLPLTLAAAGAATAGCGEDRTLYVRTKDCPDGASVCLLWTQYGDARPQTGCWPVPGSGAEGRLLAAGTPVSLDDAQPVYFASAPGDAFPGVPNSASPRLSYSRVRHRCDGATDQARACCDAPLRYEAVLDCGGAGAGPGVRPAGGGNAGAGGARLSGPGTAEPAAAGRGAGGGSSAMGGTRE
jgi:hypothetical protein